MVRAARVWGNMLSPVACSNYRYAVTLFACALLPFVIDSVCCKHDQNLCIIYTQIQQTHMHTIKCRQATIITTTATTATTFCEGHNTVKSTDNNDDRDDDNVDVYANGSSARSHRRCKMATATATTTI